MRRYLLEHTSYGRTKRKIAIQVLTSTFICGALRTVNHNDSAVTVRDFRNLFHGMHNAHDVGYVSDGYNLGPFGNECLDIFDTDRAVRLQRNIFQRSANGDSRLLPRYEITVMLHFRQDDFIPGPQTGARRTMLPDSGPSSYHG